MSRVLDALKKRKIAVGLVVTASIIVAAWGYGAFSGGTEKKTLLLYGNVDIRQVDIGFKVSGRIVTLNVDEGTKVKAGDELATLDPRDFQNGVALVEARVAIQESVVAKLKKGLRSEEIAQARALVAVRQAELRNAQATLTRANTLAARGYFPHQRHDDVIAAEQAAQANLNYSIEALNVAAEGSRNEDILAAKAQLDAERAALAQARLNLSEALIRSPSAGVILTRVHEAGAIVAAGQPIFSLALISPVWVRTYVPEPDLGRIRPGAKVTIKTDGGRDFVGTVGFISPVAEFTPKTVETSELRTALVYRVRI
ncbi:MAG: efflux RND transporter periplasmic adaptor subunit, partial [Micropepsaceae bacterium]